MPMNPLRRRRLRRLNQLQGQTTTALTPINPNLRPAGTTMNLAQGSVARAPVPSGVVAPRTIPVPQVATQLNYPQLSQQPQAPAGAGMTQRAIPVSDQVARRRRRRRRIAAAITGRFPMPNKYGYY